MLYIIRTCVVTCCNSTRIWTIVDTRSALCYRTVALAVALVCACLNFGPYTARSPLLKAGQRNWRRLAHRLFRWNPPEGSPRACSLSSTQPAHVKGAQHPRIVEDHARAGPMGTVVVVVHFLLIFCSARDVPRHPKCHPDDSTPYCWGPKR